MAWRRLAAVVVTVFALAAAVGPRDTDATASPIIFVTAPSSLIAACHRTARAVGYRVPCPTKVPQGLTATGALGPTGCSVPIIGAGGVAPCTRSWRGWVIGSSAAHNQHLVLTASPKPLDDVHLVNGPAWDANERVRLLGRMTLHGRRVHVVFVPPSTNDGSAFASHVVLIWSVGGHTYGLGFHDVRGIDQTLRLDNALLAGVVLIGP
jgi:hypothetical protein